MREMRWRVTAAFALATFLGPQIVCALVVCHVALEHGDRHEARPSVAGLHLPGAGVAASDHDHALSPGLDTAATIGPSSRQRPEPPIALAPVASLVFASESSRRGASRQRADPFPLPPRSSPVLRV